MGAAVDMVENNRLAADLGTEEDFPTREMKFLEMGSEEEEKEEGWNDFVLAA